MYRGVINIEYSDVHVSDCFFKDNFSLINGGIFNIINANEFIANNIESYNTTAIEKVNICTSIKKTKFLNIYCKLQFIINII